MPDHWDFESKRRIRMTYLHRHRRAALPRGVLAETCRRISFELLLASDMSSEGPEHLAADEEASDDLVIRFTSD
jgi:hypothetical protein